MTTFRFRFVLLFLTVLALVPSADAYGRKKAHRGRKGGVACIIEPDAMVARAHQEAKVLAVADFNGANVSGSINSRYREGIDVSHYQGNINWDQVAGSTKISYAYLKATEGATYVDDTYAYNLREARRVGLSVGSYHFYRPNVPVRQQFDNIVSNIKAEEQDLIPLIDVEHRGRVSDKKFIRDLKELLRLLEKHYGKKPLLYSYQNFYNRHLCGHFDGYHWMIAKYQDEKPVLNDDTDYIMWQYTAKGSIEGIRGHVDRSRIMGDFHLHQVGL